MSPTSSRDGSNRPENQRQSAPDPEATVVMQDAPEGEREERPINEDAAAALASAEAKAAEHRSDYLRALAELDNMRKRSQRDVESAHRYGLEKFAQELLAVKDGLEMGLDAGQKANQKANDRNPDSGIVQTLLAGQDATLKLLARAFEKFNIKEINPLGAPFDPQLHEAMTTQPSTTAEPDSVLQVIQKGYQLNDRLLRPARVIVAKPPAESA
jgi:molecular chaperone GrpE